MSGSSRTEYLYKLIISTTSVYTLQRSKQYKGSSCDTWQKISRNLPRIFIPPLAECIFQNLVLHIHTQAHAFEDKETLCHPEDQKQEATNVRQATFYHPRTRRTKHRRCAEQRPINARVAWMPYPCIRATRDELMLRSYRDLERKQRSQGLETPTCILT